MSEFRNQSKAHRSDYVWQYEYYDEEEPVSFEGLKAHRYSIVIGFWVGLAVFVIFMFFVLTLLTKTGAPHPENPDLSEKRHRPGSCLVDVDGRQEENDKAFSRPLLAGSRSYFNFYIHEEDQEKQKETNVRSAKDQKTRTEENPADAEREQTLSGLVEEKNAECVFLNHFNIPNFVNLDPGSTLGEDDVMYEPSFVLERHCDLH